MTGQPAVRRVPGGHGYWLFHLTAFDNAWLHVLPCISLMYSCKLRAIQDAVLCVDTYTPSEMFKVCHRFRLCSMRLFC